MRSRRRIAAAGDNARIVLMVVMVMDRVVVMRRPGLVVVAGHDRPGRCRRRRYGPAGSAQEILSAGCPVLMMRLLLDALLQLFQCRIGERRESD